MKVARAFTGRPGIVSFSGGFHGRTHMGMALTGKVVPYKKGFGPFPADVYNVAFPNTYHGVSGEQSLDALKALFKYTADPSSIAAIIIEPVQGEGGFYIAPFDFLRSLRALCDEHGILLVADEIQTGFARTGKMFALEHVGIKADVVTMAKGLAGGFPLSAITGRADVMDASSPGGLGGTYAGNPVACAAAHAVLDAIEEEKLCDRANAIGKIILDRCHADQKPFQPELRRRRARPRRHVRHRAGEGHRERRAGAPAHPNPHEGRQRERAYSPFLRHVWECYPLPRAAHRERPTRARRHGHLRSEPHRSRDPGRVSSTLIQQAST